MLDYLPWLINMSGLEYWGDGIVVGVSIAAIVVAIFWLGFLALDADYENYLGIKRLCGAAIILVAAFFMLSGIKSYGIASDRYDYQGSYLDSTRSTVDSMAIAIRQPGENASLLKDRHGPIEVTVATKGSKGSVSLNTYLCRATECLGLTVSQPLDWLVYRPYGASSWYLLPPGASR